MPVSSSATLSEYKFSPLRDWTVVPGAGRGVVFGSEVKVATLPHHKNRKIFF
jgi:hypothetical protein